MQAQHVRAAGQCPNLAGQLINSSFSSPLRTPLAKEKDICPNGKNPGATRLHKSFAREGNGPSSRRTNEVLKNLGLIRLRGYTFAGMWLYAI
jgi:hypothetical protein